MQHKSFVRGLAALATVGLLGTACAKSQTTTTSQEPSAAPSETAMMHETPTPSASPGYAAAYASVREAYAHMFATGDGLVSAIATQKGLGAVKSPAIDARVKLDSQLAEHAGLAVFAMQKGLDGSKDFDAIAKALDANSVDLSATIASVYGKDAGDAFLKQWRDHIRMFVDFTVATAKSDQAGRQKALDELSQYKVSFAKFLTGNTGLDKAAGLQADAVAGLLQMHVDQLTKALDAYKAKDYAAAYAQLRESYAHMFGTGDALIAAIAKQKSLGSTSGKAADTRVLLDRQLAEHALLAVFAMQKGASGAPDFDAIAKALDANSVDLSATIASVYGKDAGDAFLKQWRDHIRMFVDFTVATAKSDQAGRQKALEELSQYKVSFAKFLTANTGLDKAAGLQADAVASLLQMHVDQLTKALDTYLGRTS